MDYSAIVEQHYQKLYYFAYSLAKQESDAWDLTQSAYLKLAKKSSKIREPSKVKSWLFSTVYREFLDQRRRSLKFPECDLENSYAIHSSKSNESQNKLDYETAIAFIMELDESLRAPLTLFYVENSSYQEISEILKTPIGTVMSRLHRGKMLLHRRIHQFQTRGEQKEN
ncbi:MAG: RNA polymerase sigma factor [Verrucomicrobiota bacterium]